MIAAQATGRRERVEGPRGLRRDPDHRRPARPRRRSPSTLAPADPAVDGTYDLVATGGSSGDPVTFAVDRHDDERRVLRLRLRRHLPPRRHLRRRRDPGRRRRPRAAPTSTQRVDVAPGRPVDHLQPAAPSTAEVGDSYEVSATGGGSGNPVDGHAPPTADVCAVVRLHGLVPRRRDLRDHAPTRPATGLPGTRRPPPRASRWSHPSEADLAVTAEQTGDIGGTPA